MVVKIIEDSGISCSAHASVVIEYLRKHAGLDTVPNYLRTNGFREDDFGIGQETQVLVDSQRSGVKDSNLIKRLIFPRFHREWDLELCEVGKVYGKDGCVNISVNGQEYVGRINEAMTSLSKEKRDFPDINIILWQAKPKMHYPGRVGGVSA